MQHIASDHLTRSIFVKVTIFADAMLAHNGVHFSKGKGWRASRIDQSPMTFAQSITVTTLAVLRNSHPS